MTDACRSCGATVRFVPSATSGKPMILDATPEKRIVLGEPITFDTPDDALVVGKATGGRGIPTVARVVDTYVDHHATCPRAADWKGRRR